MVSAAPFDSIIVGGGLSGGLAALALADAGLACALIDAADPSTTQSESFDGRTTALAYASARVFQRLGLWERLANNAQPITEILVTDGRRDAPGRRGAVSPFHLHFDSRELKGGEPLGWIIENRRLRRALFERISERGVALYAPAQRTGASFRGAAAAVTLAEGPQIEAPLVIAADGRHSRLRSEAQIKINAWSYAQTGLVATVVHARPHEGVAQELFLPDGPFAILPMTSDEKGRHRSSLVWTEMSAVAPAYLGLGDGDFLRAIEARIGPCLGELGLAGPRWSYPLSFHLAQSYIAPRLALIGDAAHAIHPIAGQGFNLGVKDIAALAEVVKDARELGLDIGSMTTLMRYQRWRRFDSALLAFGTDALNRLFSNNWTPIRVIRDAGMGAVNAFAPLRRFFMHQAGADLGRLPALMRPF